MTLFENVEEKKSEEKEEETETVIKGLEDIKKALKFPPD